MYPRVNYEMTEAELEEILDACKPTVCMQIGSYEGSTPQENANEAWRKLGEKRGFDYMTVQPIEGMGQRFFSAVPTETEEQRKEREARESREREQREISELEAEIADRKLRLKKLKASAKRKEGK